MICSYGYSVCKFQGGTIYSQWSLLLDLVTHDFAFYVALLGTQQHNYDKVAAYICIFLLFIILMVFAAIETLVSLCTHLMCVYAYVYTCMRVCLYVHVCVVCVFVCV